jgi:hypothetical protein
LLILKLIIVPLFIAGVTFAGHRWGPAVAGWLAGLPIVSGPILLFLAIEQGTPFAAHAAMGTLAGVIGPVCFVLIYCWMASRNVWWPLCLVCGWSGYFAAITFLYVTAPQPLLAALYTAAALIVGPRIFPRVPASAPITISTYAEVACRMVGGAVLVVLVTRFSASLGPQLSGLFAVFPVVASVLAVFTHRYSGYQYTVLLLRGLVYGLIAFSVFCFVLSVTLVPWGIVAGFLVSIVAALIVHCLTRTFALRRA